MDMFIYMGIIEDLKKANKDLKQYSLRDIKKIYNEIMK